LNGEAAKKINDAGGSKEREEPHIPSAVEDAAAKQKKPDATAHGQPPVRQDDNCQKKEIFGGYKRHQTLKFAGILKDLLTISCDATFQTFSYQAKG